jgi:hypothetical protein
MTYTQQKKNHKKKGTCGRTVDVDTFLMIKKKKKWKKTGRRVWLASQALGFVCLATLQNRTVHVLFFFFFFFYIFHY